MQSIYEKRPWLSSYPDGVAHDLETATATAIDDFNKSVLSRPDFPAVCYFDHAISYREVNRLAESLAAAFHDFGLQAGDRIIVDLQKRAPIPCRNLCCVETRNYGGSGEPHVQGAGAFVLFS